jgi:hypothetical protein
LAREWGEEREVLTSLHTRDLHSRSTRSRSSYTDIAHRGGKRGEGGRGREVGTACVGFFVSVCIVYAVCSGSVCSVCFVSVLCECCVYLSLYLYYPCTYLGCL